MTIWMWDASALHHAVAADRLDVLLDYAKSAPAAPQQHLVTDVVAAELTSSGLWEACEQHVEVVRLTTLAELTAVIKWGDVVSHGKRSRGEATAFAWAEVNSATVIIDDRDARRAARRYGLTVHGTVWILGNAVRAGSLNPAAADSFVETLRSAGARLPVWPAGGILTWLDGDARR